MSYKNIPRLYINKELKVDTEVKLEKKDSHYLKNVLRLKPKYSIKLFNGIDGEWEAKITNNNCNNLICKKLIRSQNFTDGPTLYFSLIKNHNLKWLLEKSTELGVKTLSPILTERVNIRKFNYDKARLYIKEASEVSERIELPALKSLKTIRELITEFDKKKHKNIYFCNETRGDRHLSSFMKESFSKNCAFVIGPEGGFSDKEINIINSYPNVTSTKLNNRILRAETAAIYVLSIYNNYLELSTK